MKHTLRFSDPAQEAAFLRHHEDLFNDNIRKVYTGMIWFVPIYVVVELIFFNEKYTTFVGLYTLLPTFVVLRFLAAWKPFLEFVRGKCEYHATMFSITFLGALEVFLNYKVPDYYAPGSNKLLLVHIACVHSLLKLRVRYSTTISTALIGISVALQVLTLQKVNLALVLTTFAANALGAWLAWQFERHERREFVRRFESEKAAAKLKEMLANVIPSDVAEHLKTSSSDHLHYQQEVPDLAVLFSDLSGFTKFSTSVAPKKLIHTLNTINSKFDTEADRLGISKIKTLGDAAVYVSGLTGSPNPAALREMAEAMLVKLDEANRELGISLNIRIGLGRGRAIVGVIGKLRVKFDVWGDAIDAAELHQKAARPGEIRDRSQVDAAS